MDSAQFTFRWRFGYATLLSLSAVSFLCFSLPVLLYSGNRAEFATPLAELLVPVLLPAAAFALVLALLVSLLPERPCMRLLVLGNAVCLLLWLQGTVLVWGYGLFDGSRIDWSVARWRGWLDAGIWIATLLGVDALRDRLARALPRLVMIACALQAGIAGFTLVREQDRVPASRDVTALSMARFSKRANVIHILADGMQTGVVADLLDEDNGRLSHELEGFTMFEDNLGAFPYTHMSVPAMLGGNIYDNSEPVGEFLDRSLGHASILGAAQRAGYEVKVAQPGGGISEVYRHVLDAQVLTVPSSPRFAGWRGARQERLLLGDLVLFRVVPHFAKAFVYNDENWFLQELFGIDSGPGRAYLAHNAFLRDLGAQAHADDTRPQYKFVHLFLSHRPIVMRQDCSYAGGILEPNLEHVRNQARCTFRTIAALLGRLRQLGIYDQTTVVISGDHGIFLAPRSMPPGSAEAARAYARDMPPGMIGEARPLLLVKPARAHGPLQRSWAPTSIADTPATIADAAGIDAVVPGDSAFRLVVGESRERHYHLYDYLASDWTARYLTPMQRYLVRGRADRIDSWSPGPRLEAPPGAR